MYRKSELVKTGIPYVFWPNTIKIQYDKGFVGIEEHLSFVNLQPLEFDLLDIKGLHKHLNSIFKRGAYKVKGFAKETRLVREVLVRMKQWAISMAQEGNRIDTLATIENIHNNQSIRLNGHSLTKSDILRWLMIYSEEQFSEISTNILEDNLKALNESLDYYPRISYFLEIAIFIKEENQPEMVSA